MKSSTNLKLHNRAKKEYHSLSRRLYQLIVVISVVIIQFGSYQNSQAQDFWIELNTPTNKTNTSIAIDNNGDIYLGAQTQGDSGGVYISSNLGMTWEYLGLTNYDIYSLTFNHSGDLLAGVNSGIFKYNNDDNSWERVYYIIGNTLVIERGFNSTVFGAGWSIDVSQNDGNTWNEVLYHGELSSDIAVQSEDTIYFSSTYIHGDGGGVYQSLDGGYSWQHFGLLDHYVSSLEFNSDGDLYAGSEGNYSTGWAGLYKMYSGSTSWDTLLYWPRITSIAVTREDVIYCGFYLSHEAWGGVIHSEDHGDTWIIDTSGMGNVGIISLELDNNESLFALSSNSNTRLFKSVLPVGVDSYEVKSNTNPSYCNPNPFIFETRLHFDVSNDQICSLELKIFSVAGHVINTNKLIKTL